MMWSPFHTMDCTTCNMLIVSISLIFAQFHLGISAPSIAPSSELNLHGFSLDEFKLESKELSDHFNILLKEISNGMTKSVRFQRPVSSVIPPYFKYIEIDSNDTGHITYEDKTSNISPESLSNDVYSSTDHGVDSVVKVKKDDKGKNYLSGFIGDHLVQWDGKNHKITSLVDIYDQIDREIKGYLDGDSIFSSEISTLNRKVRQETENATEEGEDEEDDNIPLQYGRALDTGPYIAFPEVLFIVDYNNSKHFNFDQQKVIDYLSVMINSINLKYAQLSDPKYTFLLVGAYVTKTPAIEASWTWTNDGRLDHHKVIKQVGGWAWENKDTLPNHDLIALITANKFIGGTAGLATVKGACGFHNENFKRDESISINHDSNGVWHGKHVLVHEFAHNLGSFHDGEAKSPTAAPCSWELGHIMSYKGWGELSKLKFSDCTVNAFKDFMRATNSDCLRKNQTAPISTSNDLVQKRVDTPSICKGIFLNKGDGDPRVIDHVEPDKMCRVLYCDYKTHSSFSAVVPEDGWKCGRSGTCKDGFCVGNTAYTDQNELNKICKDKIDNPAATYDPDIGNPKDGCTRITCNTGQGYASRAFWLGDGASCGWKGTCKNGDCVGYKSYDPNDKKTLNEICQKRLNSPDASYAPDIIPSSSAACTYLPCKSKSSYKMSFLWMGDGFPCGKKGKCKDGQCVGG